MTESGYTQHLSEAVLTPGQLLTDKYRVERLVGVGGMAAVWAGTNELTGKQVAIKVIVRSLSVLEDVSTRFRREALAAGRINHPNVVTVFDVIEHKGLTAIVMELLNGESLHDRLARDRLLGADEAVDLLLPAMRGVRAAHQHGVIHRDLKPANIFLCKDADGDIETVKVLDFGVSKLKEEKPDPRSATMAGAIMGTPAYMSPEQINSARDVDQRTDVYAVGVVLYQTLAGKTPFDTDSASALMVKIATETAPPVATVRPEIPEALARIVDRSISKRVEERHQTMTELIAELERWRGVSRNQTLRQLGQESPDSVSASRPAGNGNRRFVLIGVGIGTLLAVAALGLMLRKSDQSDEVETRAAPGPPAQAPAMATPPASAKHAPTRPPTSAPPPAPEEPAAPPTTAVASEPTERESASVRRRRRSPRKPPAAAEVPSNNPAPPTPAAPPVVKPRPKHRAGGLSPADF